MTTRELVVTALSSVAVAVLAACAVVGIVAVLP